MSSMLVFLLWLPVGVVFGLQYLFTLHELDYAQKQTYSITDNAAVLAASDIDWASYMLDQPKLVKSTAVADAATGLTTGFSNISNYLAGPGASGLTVWVGNPGEVDPVTNHPVTLPTVRIYGMVVIDPLGNGTTYKISVNSSANLHPTT